MATPLIFQAAERYRSSSTGETVRASAILSKPKLESSAGSKIGNVDLEAQ